MTDIEEMDEKKSGESPNDSSERIANILARAFEATKMIEIVEVQHSLGQIHFMCRIATKNEKEVTYGVVFPVLEATQGKCDVFMGKQFLLGKNKEKRYAWVIGVGSDDLDQACKDICNVLEAVIPKPVVMEAPLFGPSTPSGSVKGGKKGASTVSYGG